jgi:hypothetical protein
MKTPGIKLLGLLLLLGQLTASAKTRPAEINQKLIRAFQEAFPKAEGVEWKDNGERYVVHFTEKAIFAMIEYDHAGNFISSVRYFSDPYALPSLLSATLQRKYADKSVFGITEITTEEGRCYYIKLEDKKKWITVKATADGSTEVVEKIGKQE